MTTSASNSQTNSAIVKMRSQEIITTAAVGSPTVRTSPQNVGGQTTTTSLSSSPNWSKIQALKQRKTDLEKLLNEKNHVLQQIQRQEQQIIARNFNYINSSSGGCGSSSGTATSTLRRKIGTSFKMPNNKNGYTAKELGGSVGDMEKKVRQEILNASYKIVHDPKQLAVRRMYKADYEAAQQKLNAINHGVNLLKKQHHQRSLHSAELNDSPNAAITLNLTKTPSLLVGEQQNTMKNGATLPDHSTTTAILDASLSSNKFGSNNSVNYYTKERRNSIKSMQQQQQHSPPSRLYNEGDRSPTMHLMKPHRSDYDLPSSSNHLLIVTTTTATTPQSELSPGGYLYENSAGDTILVNRGSSSGIDGAHFYTNNAKFMTAPNRYSVVPIDAFNNSFHHSIHGQHQPRTTTTTPSSFQQQQQHQYDDEAATFLAQRAYSRKYQQQMYGGGGGDTTDSISLSPSIGVLSGHNNDPEQSAVGVGLGGYWRTYGNERVWCTVDTSYDSSSLQPNGKLKKSHTISTTPTKSLSLGNFDVIGNVRDDGTDKISISSMNSETSRQNRQKEKQWLETSLDGPTIKTKQSTAMSSSLSPTASYHQHPPPLQQQQQKYNHHTRKQQQQQSNYRDRSKLSSSQSISSATYRTPPRLEDQSYLSHSTSVLHSSGGGGGGGGGGVVSSDGLFTSPPAPSSSHPYSFHHHHHHLHHHHHPQQLIAAKQSTAETLKQQPSPTTITPPPPIPPSSMLLKQQQQQHHHQHEHTSISNPQSPSHIAASFNHDSTSIRIESPKNVTVIQQAVFMPYKEITKPFEMSDFYKYSTKFRQKDKQQPPHVQVEQ